MVLENRTCPNCQMEDALNYDVIQDEIWCPCCDYCVDAYTKQEKT